MEAPHISKFLNFIFTLLCKFSFISLVYSNSQEIYCKIYGKRSDALVGNYIGIRSFTYKYRVICIVL